MLSRRSVIGGLLIGLAPALGRAGAAPWNDRLVAAARRQIGVTTLYDPAYIRLSFPGGDPPIDRGVCTDVVVRAYRAAFGLDLQRLVNADMAAHFAAYPKRWRLTRPDPSIDHRRVPNLEVFFARRGVRLPPSQQPDDFQPGDIVAQLLPGNLPHIGIVSAARAPGERPLVIHNIGGGAREEDTLFAFPHTGHYRAPPEKLR